MRKGIIHSAIKHKKVTLFMVFLVIILGVYSYYIIPKQEAPDITAPVSLITTIYPGASPEDVEALVTSKIENQIKEIKGYEYSNSYSYNSISTVILRLEYGTDTNEAWNDLRQSMNDLQSKLPKECYDIEINSNLVETAGIILSLSGENYTYEELTLYAENIKNELSKINGISSFEINGEQNKEISIEVDIEKLNFYSLSLQDIINIIRSQNIEIPLGSIHEEESKLNLSVNGTYSNIDEIKNTIIAVSSENGSIIRLEDIANVSIKLKDSNYKIMNNNKKAVLLTGYFKNDKNIVIIGKDVEKKLKNIKGNLPKDISINEVLYQPKEVSESVNNFIMNLIQGVAFVVLVVLIGMGLRNAVIVSTAIPISILLTFITMNVLGIKIHQISIASLIVSLGMLVDNAIVISDAIQTRIDNDEEKMDACIKGVKEVAVPILTSTLTTIGAFLPLLLLSSIAGEYISSLPKIVIIALFSSYLVAILVTPTMAYIFFKKSERGYKVGIMRLLFGKMLKKAMKRRIITIFIIIIAISSIGFIVTKLNLQFFPKADKDYIYIDIKSDKNIDISYTKEIVDEVLNILENQAEITQYTTSIGSGLPKFYDSIPIVVKSSDVAQILLKLDLSKSERFISNTEIADYLQNIFDENIEKGKVLVKQLELAEPIGFPIRVRLTGGDINKLNKVSEEIKSLLSQINGTVNIDDDFSDNIAQYNLNIDSEKGSLNGISKYDIQNELNIALRGRNVSVFKENGKELDIVVKSNIKSKNELENIAIKSQYISNKVLLKELANIKLIEKIPIIRKYDGNLAIMVTSDVKSGYNPVDIQKELSKKIEDLNIDNDIDIAFDGEKEKIAENFGSVGNSAFIAVLLIFAILLIQFKSFMQPFIILITIPLSAIGSVIALYLFKQPLSFTALLGIVSLIGIVVNNAIVLIDYINNERNNGKSIKEACLESSNKRFRPIILSTITTVIGLTPLVFSGSELFRPMALSLMSGLLVSTLLTLIIIPVVYSLVQK